MAQTEFEKVLEQTKLEKENQKQLEAEAPIDAAYQLALEKLAKFMVYSGDDFISIDIFGKISKKKFPKHPKNEFDMVKESVLKHFMLATSNFDSLTTGFDAQELLSGSDIDNNLVAQLVIFNNQQFRDLKLKLAKQNIKIYRYALVERRGIFNGIVSLGIMIKYLNQK